jgi:hypothetical protein
LIDIAELTGERDLTAKRKPLLTEGSSICGQRCFILQKLD